MNVDIPVKFPMGGIAGSQTSFATPQTFKQGSWKLTNAKVNGITGSLTGVPRTEQLPGGLGAPVLDFTGGPCPLP
jgi:hypothetical protein